MLTIDGSQGEGGGQILRTALSLSLVSGKPFRIWRTRAGRKKPGLLRQHLTAVNAAREIGRAEVAGAEIGSRELTFVPRGLVGGKYRFAVGSAGSATLVLQAVLPALLTAARVSELTLEGGTHNPFAPPYEFLEKAFLPVVNRMGAEVEVRLERHGFYPAGGGRLHVAIRPAVKLSHIDLRERGEVRGVRVRAVVSSLPRSIAERELRVVAERLPIEAESLEIVEVKSPRGPGNVLMIEIECGHVTEVVTGFGRRGLRAEAVAEGAVRRAVRYLEAGAPVGEHLADQLLVPLAVAGGGVFRTGALSPHAVTNIEVIKQFLGIETDLKSIGAGIWQIEI